MLSAIFRSCPIALRAQILVSHLFALQQALPHVDKILGFPQIYAAPTWHGYPGLLPQLRRTVSMVLEDYDSLALKKLRKEIDLAWIAGIKTFEKKSALPLLIKHFRQFPPLIAQLLFSLPPDENLYFFLLRHQKECKDIFGTTFLISLLNHTHPQGLKQTERFLNQRYQRRGFGHLKPTIRTLIASLE